MSDEPIVVAHSKNGYIGEVYHDLGDDGGALCGRVGDPKKKPRAFAEAQGLDHCVWCAGEFQGAVSRNPYRRIQALESVDDIVDGQFVDEFGEPIRADGGGNRHPQLQDLDVGETVRAELDDDTTLVAEIDGIRVHEEGEIIGNGLTLLADPTSRRGNVWDVETEYDPRSGWSDIEASRREYTGSTTKFVPHGVVESIDTIALGISTEELDPGVTIEHADGTEYRVVMAPWEREYDDKALAFPLDRAGNHCEKVDPEEVVRRV